MATETTAKATKSVEALITKRMALADKVSELEAAVRRFKEEKTALDTAIIERTKMSEGGRLRLTGKRVFELKKISVAERTQTVPAFSYYRMGVSTDVPEDIPGVITG